MNAQRVKAGLSQWLLANIFPLIALVLTAGGALVTGTVVWTDYKHKQQDLDKEIKAMHTTLDTLAIGQNQDRAFSNGERLQLGQRTRQLENDNIFLKSEFSNLKREISRMAEAQEKTNDLIRDMLIDARRTER